MQGLYSNFQYLTGEIIEMSFDLIGDISSGKKPSADQYRKGRLWLNTLVQSLEADTTIRLWSRQRTGPGTLLPLNLVTGGVPTGVLTPGVATYQLPMDTLEVMSEGFVVRNPTTNIDQIIKPMRVGEYQESVANKVHPVQSLPSRFCLEYNVVNTDPVSGKQFDGGLQVTFDPAPDQAYPVGYVRSRKLQNYDSPVTDPDLPPKWSRLLVYGLAYELGVRSGLVLAERAELKKEYNAELEKLRSDDTERGSIFLSPMLPQIWNG